MNQKDKQHMKLSGWRRNFNEWILLCVGLSITVFLAYSFKSMEEAGARDKFEAVCKQIQLNIEARLHEHEQVLKGGAALFEASKSVERKEWHDYVRRIKQDNNFKGIEGFGFALLVPPAQLPAHIEQIRREGFSDYTIWPSGARDSYTSIIYVEPFDGPNLSTLGYDMWSEPAHRAAMQQARDENIAALTGRIIPAQENGHAAQSDRVMYVPVYRNGMPIDTAEQRRTALFGWVYSPFRMKDLMHGISGIPRQDVIRMKIFDGYNTRPSALLYDNAEGNDSYFDVLPSDPLIWHSRLGGREWTLQFVLSTKYLSADYGKTGLVAVGGSAISLLLFFFIRTYRKTCRDALSIADNLVSERHQSDARYRILMEQSSDAVFLVDPDTLALDEVNQRFFQMFGYTGRQSRQLLLTDIIPIPKPEIHSNLQRVLDGGGSDGWEEQVFHARNGSLLNVEVSKSAVQAGLKKKVLITVHDISRCRLAEAECARMERQLQQFHKMAELGQLTGGIIHDVNNILAVMLGYSSLALARYAADKESALARYLEEVNTAGERARDLVARMLNYSRNQADTAAALAPAPLVMDAIKMLASTIPSGIKLQVHIADDIPTINISQGELQQIVMNLVINARDAVTDQGCVDIHLNTLVRTPMSCISCSVARSNAVCRGGVSGRYVSLSVSDNGCGIKKKDLKQIFDRSFTTKEVGKGTGFGLAVVEGIVRRANGCVLVDSCPGDGTTIQVLLPISGAFVDLPAVATPLSMLADGNGARILVVDDEPALAYYLEELLEGENYQVDVYTNSVEALNYFHANLHSFDAVITDQTMPNKAGIEIAKSMLALRPDLPVFLCSGYSDTVDEVVALSFGIRRFFNKPVSATELLTALDEEITHPAAA